MLDFENYQFWETPFAKRFEETNFIRYQVYAERLPKK